MSITELRKELKSIGFKVKLTSMSWGRAATYTDMDGNHRPMIFFCDEKIKEWRPLTHYINDNHERLRSLANSEKITGLI
jgi:hypothetical protein